jgi:hypothetical protein
VSPCAEINNTIGISKAIKPYVNDNGDISRPVQAATRQSSINPNFPKVCLDTPITIFINSAATSTTQMSINIRN